MPQASLAFRINVVNEKIPQCDRNDRASGGAGKNEGPILLE